MAEVQLSEEQAGHRAPVAAGCGVVAGGCSCSKVVRCSNQGTAQGLEKLEAAETRSGKVAWLSLKDLGEPSFSSQAICHGRQRLGALHKT